MKTLIVYGTKHGTTKKIVDILKAKIQGDVQLHDAKKRFEGDLNDYDVIIIGSSVYVGKINKELKNFVESNTKEIIEKKIGVFLVSGDTKEIESYYQNFPEEILKKAATKGYFGFSYNGKGYNIMEKMILKMIAKNITVKEKFEEENMDKFLNDLGLLK